MKSIRKGYLKKNKKVINATICSSNGITFKSKLEMNTYTILKELGFNPLYEFKTFELYKEFVPKIPFYSKETACQHKKRVKKDGNKNLLLSLKDTKVQGIHYTPDFYFKYKNLDVYMETKGIPNETYYLRKKLFRKYLNDKFIKTGQKSIFFEITSLAQLRQAAEIIKNFK